MQTTWNFSLFYKSDKDPQILKDIEKIKHAYTAFERKYRSNNKYLTSETVLLKALTDYEALILEGSGKPFHYWGLKLAQNSSDSETEAKSTKYANELTPYENKLLFFELSLGKIPKKKQQQFLKSKKLAHFHYYLRKLFENSKYNLTEPEEKILNFKSLPSYSLWVQGFEKLLNKQTISFQDREIPLGEAQNILMDLPLDERRALWRKITEKFYGISDFAESEMNAIVLNKKISDDLRGRKTPYESTITSYQNDPKVVLKLIDEVTNHYAISHRFYELKRQMLNVPFLEYADRSARVGTISKKYSFEEAVDYFRRSLEKLGPRYTEILDRYLKEGQIDVYPKQHKDTGAFCSSGVSTPTFVLLNHTNTFRSVTTLAHEMGHAIHAELGKGQSPMYQGCSMAVAETASTFFENFVFEELVKTLSREEQVIALHDQINDDIATVFRQIAFFNFEKDLHYTIREKGSIPKEEIARLLNTHMERYLGPAVKLHEKDGYFFVAVSHFRRFFYVYAYAFGQIISRSLYQRFKEDPTYFSSVEKFMLAGESDTPENIFKKSGVNLKDPNFFQEGLKLIERNIKKLEALVKEIPSVSLEKGALADKKI